MKTLRWLIPGIILLVSGGLYWFNQNKPSLVAYLVVSKMLEANDVNEDGALSETEAPAGMFSLLDANGDGLADASELRAMIASSLAPFRWVNAPKPQQVLAPGLQHATFRSPSMDRDVGYYIYLPPSYDESNNRALRYPVIYYLHGGRPGNESRSIGLAESIHTLVSSRAVQPLIVVWVNGGEVSHYNYGASPGETVFVRELIPHIDQSYRTVAARGGRALQGFSQGGRSTTRIMFKYPELFVSAAPGGAGYTVERQIADNNGVEIDQRQGSDAQALDFGAGNDAFTLAQSYAKNLTTQDPAPSLPIMLWGGTKGFNYSAVLDYQQYLNSLDIPSELLIAESVDHNPLAFYAERGAELLAFHDRHWQLPDSPDK